VDGGGEGVKYWSCMQVGHLLTMPSSSNRGLFGLVLRELTVNMLFVWLVGAALAEAMRRPMAARCWSMSMANGDNGKECAVNGDMSERERKCE
jgi:hypothetical protein